MTRHRFYSILPGALVWFTLITSVVLSFVEPLWMIYFILLFDLYWLLRIVYFIPFLLVSWWRYRQALKRNWGVEAAQLEGFDQTYQLIFLPMVNESESVVRETLRVVSESTFPSSRIWIVLAGEARAAATFCPLAERLRQDFQATFFRFSVTVHPADIVGEVIGKGSNLHWAAEQVVPQIVQEGISPERVIVSAFDVDTLVHREYLSCITYVYLTVDEPTHSSYQPVALYNNNLWESPAPVRVAMFGTTFWLMTELARPEGMMTFSSHSMSLRMLMDVGYWQADIVSEDSRIFLQGLVHYHGRYRVTPIHLPVSMDTVMTDRYFPALKALYKQLRRWAWGVENFPYMMEMFWSSLAPAAPCPSTRLRHER